MKSASDRTKGIGIIGAAFGLGFICGPAIAAVLVNIAHWLPGVAAETTSAVALVLVAVALPETRRAESGAAASGSSRRLGGLPRVAGYPMVGASLATVFLIIFAFSNFETTFAQLLRSSFAMEMSSVGWMFVYAGVLGAVVQGGRVGRLARRFGEPRLIAVGGGIAAAAAGGLPFAGSTGGLLLVLAVLAVGHGLLAPSLSAFTSRLVPAHELGSVMGVSQGVSSVARIFGPFRAEWVYGGGGPALPYLSAAVALALGPGCAITPSAPEQSSRPITGYLDYSWDKNSVLFNTREAHRQTVFLDTFYPFDPSLRYNNAEAMVRYELDHKPFVQDGVLMVALADLRKLYAPYFSYTIDAANQHFTVQHHFFRKHVAAGSGSRAPKLEYTKIAWEGRYALAQTAATVSQAVHKAVNDRNTIDQSPAAVTHPGRPATLAIAGGT